MQRFWISWLVTLAVALALAVPPAYAGKLGSIEQVAKTYAAKKDNGRGSHSITNHGFANHGAASGGIASGGHGKAGQIMGRGKKLLGK